MTAARDRAGRLHLRRLRPVAGGPEVHADGEIWAQTLWDLRQRLIAATAAPAGSDLAEQLITDGMRLSPPEPSFLDMRNAILQADAGAAAARTATRSGSLFAARGMGYFAGALRRERHHPDRGLRHAARPGRAARHDRGQLTDATSGLPVAGRRSASAGTPPIRRSSTRL